MSAAWRAPGKPWRRQEIGREKATGVVLHANARRVTAVAWETVGRADAVHLAVARPGRRFAAAQAVPLPPGAADAGGASVAVAPDGSVAITYRAGERGDAPATAVLVVRRPDGSFSRPQILATGVLSGPFVKAGTGGSLHALWSATEGPIRRIFVADGSPSGGLGAARALSDATLDADNRAAPPVLAANERGDLLAVWSPMAPRTAGVPSDVVASFRPAGGAWEAPRRVSQPGFGAFRPTAAIAPGGEAIVTWSLAQGAGAAARGRDGGWSAPQSSAVLQGTILAMPAAMQADGTAVTVRRVERFGEPERMAVLVRRAGGCLGGERELPRRRSHFSAPAIAAAPAGGGVLAWAEGQGEAWAVRVANFRARPSEAPRACPTRLPQAAPAVRVRSRTRSISRRDLLRTGVRATVELGQATAMHYELVSGSRVLASRLALADPGNVVQRVVLRPRSLKGVGRRLTLRVTRAVTLTDRVTKSYAVTVR